MSVLGFCLGVLGGLQAGDAFPELLGDEVQLLRCAGVEELDKAVNHRVMTGGQLSEGGGVGVVLQ